MSIKTRHSDVTVENASLNCLSSHSLHQIEFPFLPSLIFLQSIIQVRVLKNSIMKSTIISVATLIGAVAATKGPSGTMTYGSGSYPSSTYSADCPFVPSPTDFILFADNIQQVSAVLPNTAFLRSQDLYIQTALDFGTASSFTVPDFALGANCSLNLAIPSPQQIYGDLSQALFSGGGK